MKQDHFGNIKKSKEEFFETVIRPYHAANYESGDWDINNLDRESGRLFLRSKYSIEAEPFNSFSPNAPLSEYTANNSSMLPFANAIDLLISKTKLPVDVLRFRGGHLYFVTDIPIILPTNNEAIAYFSSMRMLNRDIANNIMQKHHKVIANNYSTILSHNYQSSINLMPREELILYLLLLGKTQQDIAAYLNVSRGYISNMISGICGKFEIVGSRVKTLIEKAYFLNYHLYIPRSVFEQEITIKQT